METYDQYEIKAKWAQELLAEFDAETAFTVQRPKKIGEAYDDIYEKRFHFRKYTIVRRRKINHLENSKWKKCDRIEITMHATKKAIALLVWYLQFDVDAQIHIGIPARQARQEEVALSQRAITVISSELKRLLLAAADVEKRKRTARQRKEEAEKKKKARLYEAELLAIFK